MEFHFARPRDASKALGVQAITLKRWRQQGRFLKGVHFTFIPPRFYLYNVELIQDWLVNQDDPDLHKLAISRYLKSLPSSKEAADLIA